MENKLLSFSDFEHLYESYGFINESEEKAEDPLLFDPFAPAADAEKIADLLAPVEEKAVAEAGPTPSEFKPLKKGEKSKRVTELQKDLGMSTKEADGSFGPATETKVKEFQKTNKLTVDGIVGVQTLRKLLELSKSIKDTAKQDADIVKRYN
jgi:peptidoglycan hydrolase-like protein with peptidoglycan-binding domain